MTLYYVDDTATGLNDGTSKTDAWTGMFSTVGTVTGGDIVLVAHTHDEDDQAVRSWTFTNASPENPIRFISVDYGSSDAYTPGAQYSGVSSTEDYTILMRDVLFDGVSFISPDNVILNGDQQYSVHRDTEFGTNDTGVGVMQSASDPSYIRLENSDWRTAASGARWNADVGDWINLEWIGGTLPVAVAQLLFIDGQARGVLVDIRGVDLSLLTRMVSIADFTRSAIPISVKLVGCELKSDFVWNSGAGRGNTRMRLEAFGCDRDSDLDAAAYKYEHYQRAGESISVDTHYRDGGSEFRSVSYSQRMTAIGGYTAKAIDDAACYIDIAVPVIAADASMEARIHVAHVGVGSGTAGALQTDEMWLRRLSPTEVATEVATLTYATTRPDYNETIADLPSSSETWTDDSTPALTVEQYISTGSFTPTIEGLAYFRLYFATGHATIDYDIYVDLAPEIL